MEMLYLSKLPTLVMTGFLCAQAAVAQATRDVEGGGSSRAAALGRLT